MGERFGILMVCTANLCRSPMMELLLTKKLSEHSRGAAWSVGSAGTNAVDGEPMHPSTQLALAELGVAEPLWRSRRLNARLVSEADLILTAGAGHRRRVVEAHPAAVACTFLVLPFADQAAMTTPAPLSTGRHPGRSLLERTVRARSRLDYEQLSRELADPIGKAADQFRATAAEIQAAMTAVVAAL